LPFKGLSVAQEILTFADFVKMIRHMYDDFVIKDV